MSDNPILDLERELVAAHNRMAPPAAGSAPATAPASEPSAKPTAHRDGHRLRPPTVLALIATLLVVGAAAAATIALTGPRSRPQSGPLPASFATGPVPADRYRVELAPNLMAGNAASWCTTFEFLTKGRAQSFGSGGCAGRDGPFVAPGGASGLGPSGRWVLYAVLAREVAAVRIEGITELLIPITVRGLPYGWKIAVAIGHSTRSLVTTGAGGTRRRLPLPPTATYLSAGGRSIAIESHPAATRLAVRTVDPSRPSSAGCAITVNYLAGLRPVRETILRAPPPSTINTGEPGYLSCASVELRYRGLPVVAAVLLDARHPGRRPQQLPGTVPLHGHPNTFVGTGAEEVGFMAFGFDETAQLYARRVGNAWLVVQGPKNRIARKAILQALHATP